MGTPLRAPSERDRKPSEKASEPAWAELSAMAAHYLQLEEPANAAALLWLTALGASTYWAQCREMCLRVIVHNVMILWHEVTGFLRKRAVNHTFNLVGD
jgi:hypothetical protein